MAMASYTGCYTDATNKSSADAPLDLAVKVSCLSITSVLLVTAKFRRPLRWDMVYVVPYTVLS